MASVSCDALYVASVSCDALYVADRYTAKISDVT
jgi:hypothetical protein